MRRSVVLGSALFLLAPSFFSALPASAQQAPAAETVPVTTFVSVLGPKYTPPPAISKDDVIVYQNKKKVNVTSWIPAQGDKSSLQLAVVVDDADSNDLAIQLNDIRAFINQQPPTTSVGVFYASNGTVQALSQFSADHAAAAKTVRIPLGYWGAYSSIYYSLQDLIKRWPVTPGTRREILLLADGLDRFHGNIPTSPDLLTTISKAQTADIMIHTIYCRGVGHITRNLFMITIGQGNLSQLTEGTGGEAFFQGLQTPIALAPFLDQLNVVLKNQYWLTFDANRAKKSKGELQRFRVSTEIKGVDISAPDQVFVPIL